MYSDRLTRGPRRLLPTLAAAVLAACLVAPAARAQTSDESIVVSAAESAGLEVTTATQADAEPVLTTTDPAVIAVSPSVQTTPDASTPTEAPATTAPTPEVAVTAESPATTPTPVPAPEVTTTAPLVVVPEVATAPPVVIPEVIAPAVSGVPTTAEPTATASSTAITASPAPAAQSASAYVPEPAPVRVAVPVTEPTASPPAVVVPSLPTPAELLDPLKHASGVAALPKMVPPVMHMLEAPSSPAAVEQSRPVHPTEQPVSKGVEATAPPAIAWQLDIGGMSGSPDRGIRALAIIMGMMSFPPGHDPGQHGPPTQLALLLFAMLLVALPYFFARTLPFGTSRIPTVYRAVALRPG